MKSTKTITASFDVNVAFCLLHVSVERHQNYAKDLIFLLASVVNLQDIQNQKVQPPYKGLLSSSCGGLGPFGPKGDCNGRTDNGFKGVRLTNLSPANNLMTCLYLRPYLFIDILNQLNKFEEQILKVCHMLLSKSIDKWQWISKTTRSQFGLCLICFCLCYCSVDVLFVQLYDDQATLS